jgi:MGT family glycosyltransferase
LKTVVLSFPSWGHIAPTLAVVSELVRRGEDVIYYSTEPARPWVEPTGAEFRAYEASHEEFDPRVPSDGLLSDMTRLLTLTEGMLPGLLGRLREDRPDCMLMDSKCLWGNLAGQALGIPAITLSVVFALRPELVQTATLLSHLYEGYSPARFLAGLKNLTAYAEVAQRLNRKYAVVCPDILHFLSNPSSLNIVFTSREFQIEGDKFDQSYKFVGPSLSYQGAELDFPMENQAGHPVIYISLGTTFNDAAPFYEECFRAFAGQPCQVILATGNRVRQEDLSFPPANFILRTHVPQLKVLEQTALFITHGGMNSINEGLLCGIPLLVVPQRGDQHLTASRVESLGAGRKLPAAEATFERLRRTAFELLSDDFCKKRALALSESLRASGGFRRAADEIIAFAARASAGTINAGVQQLF